MSKRETAGDRELAHRERKAASVACLVLGHDRSGFGLALRLQVVLREIPFLLPGRSWENESNCRVVRHRCPYWSSRVARSKVARWRGILLPRVPSGIRILDYVLDLANGYTSATSGHSSSWRNIAITLINPSLPTCPVFAGS
jgi:hypothetical protein